MVLHICDGSNYDARTNIHVVVYGKLCAEEFTVTCAGTHRILLRRLQYSWSVESAYCSPDCQGHSRQANRHGCRNANSTGRLEIQSTGTERNHKRIC